MPELNLTPHVYERVLNEETNTYERRLVRYEPYRRIAQDGIAVFMQNGKFFYEGGEEADPVPDWALADLDKMSNEARKTYGFPARVGRPKAAGTA